MLERLSDLPTIWWVVMTATSVGITVLLLWLRRQDKKLQPTPRPNRAPYDKNTYRR